MDTEQFKECTPGYEVDRDGTVYSIASNWRGYGRRALVPFVNSHGYPSVRLTINGRRIHLAVHRLVAHHYLGPKPSPLHEVRHLDGNKLNPHADNLAWGTRKENADDRERHGRTARGERLGAAIKGSDQYRAGVAKYVKACRDAGSYPGKHKTPGRRGGARNIKATPEKIRVIRAMRQSGTSSAVIAETVNLSKSLVNAIGRGEIAMWKDIT